MRAGDTVRHGPSNEKWLLAGGDTKRNEVYPCGWPETIAKMSDCTLIHACSDIDHLAMLKEWVGKQVPDVRVSHCTSELAKHETGP